MIPKILHYCWFGNNKKSALIEDCIQSWKKYCPDYEIIEWNELNFDIKCCQYVKEAYESRKWAFVSDYCRFLALQKKGGVYLDTDVELLKPIDKLISTPFAGFESINTINPGLIFACDKDNWFCYEILDGYNKDKFMLEDGILNYCTVCERATAIFEKYGLKLDNTLQHIKGYTIYPTDYFNPYNREKMENIITSNTISVHHYAASWVDNKYLYKTSNLRGKFFLLLNKTVGEKIAKKIKRIFIRIKYRRKSSS